MSTLTPYEIAGDLEEATGAFPPPVVSLTEPNVLGIDETKDITIYGSFFTPTTTVTANSGTVNAVTFITDNEIRINYTSPSTAQFIELTLDNGQSANFANIIEIVESTWLDLRAGANTFTHGNSPGLDIRYRTGMSMSQDANGMFFTGSNPWSSWVKFENLQWTRGESKICEWIMTPHTNAMMIGIASTATNETSTTQYYQHETLAYFYSTGANFWGLFGNNGTPGGGANNSNVQTINPTYPAYKLQFTEDGSAGGQFTLYGLSSTADTEWDDETNVILTMVINNTLNPNELDIMPSIIPRADVQRFLAVRVRDN